MPFEIFEKRIHDIFSIVKSACFFPLFRYFNLKLIRFFIRIQLLYFCNVGPCLQQVYICLFRLRHRQLSFHFKGTIFSYVCQSLDIRELYQRRRRQRRQRQREYKKKQQHRLIKQNNKFAPASHFFVHVFAVSTRLRHENA